MSIEDLSAMFMFMKGVISDKLREILSDPLKYKKFMREFDSGKHRYKMKYIPRKTPSMWNKFLINKDLWRILLSSLGVVIFAFGIILSLKYDYHLTYFLIGSGFSLAILGMFFDDSVTKGKP